MNVGDIMRSGSLTVRVVSVEAVDGQIAVAVLRDEGEFPSWIDPDSLAGSSAPPITRSITVTTSVGDLVIDPPLEGEDFARARRAVAS